MKTQHVGKRSFSKYARIELRAQASAREESCDFKRISSKINSKGNSIQGEKNSYAKRHTPFRLGSRGKLKRKTLEAHGKNVFGNGSGGLKNMAKRRNAKALTKTKKEHDGCKEARSHVSIWNDSGGGGE